MHQDEFYSLAAEMPINKALNQVAPITIKDYAIEKAKKFLYSTGTIKYIRKSFTDYEIIIVDDGSTDHTGEIADFYAAKYDFIKCIHKENGGLSSARNVGIAELYLVIQECLEYYGA